MKQISTVEKIFLLIIISIFAAIFCSISLVNHYLYRTAALDLGMFNQAIYSFAHLKMNHFTLDIMGDEMNYFADHFSPITILISPFYYVFGSYTLLIIQIVAILFGGIGIYQYAKLHHSGIAIPLIIFIQFCSIFGIYSALSFDYHNNVIAAMFVPWLIYYHEKADTKKIIIFFLLILASKENMALWLAFILLGLILKMYFENRKNFDYKKIFKLEIPLIVFAVIYFVFIVGYVMPSLREGIVTHVLDRYSLIGNSLSDFISNLLHQPYKIIKLLFESPFNDELTFGIKSELHLMILVSGGYALLFRPYYLLMLVPIYAQKLFSNDYALWGINGHYSIEFVPILSLCLSDFLQKIKLNNLRYTLGVLTTLMTIYFTYSTIENRKSLWYNKTNTAFYSNIHYQTPFNITEINHVISSIPDNARISVSSCIAPHLAFRDKIYHFPVVWDAEYIVLFTANSSTYPLNGNDFKMAVEKYMNDSNFQIQYNKNELLILKKKH